MSDNLFQEYKDYYSLRVEKYANNENYKNSYQAEKILSDALHSCNTLEEFKEKIGNKNEMCANALVKDETIIEKAFFEKHQEYVRKAGPERILEKADSFNNVMDLVAMVTEEYNKNSIEISMDESHRQMIYDWFLMDLIEVYDNAEVPDKYKNKMKEWADDIRKSIVRNVETLENQNASWQVGWRLKPEQIMEYRHKRLIPYSDEHIFEMLEKYKSITNR